MSDEYDLIGGSCTQCQSFSCVYPFALFHYFLETIQKVSILKRDEIKRNKYIKRTVPYVWRKYLQPSRCFIRPAVPQTKRQALIVHLPLPNTIPLQFHHLTFQRTIFSTSMQFNAIASYCDHHMSSFSRITCTMRKYNFAITRKFTS